MIISMDTEKKLCQNLTFIYDKSTPKKKNGYRGTYFNIIKGIYNQATVHIILNGEKLKVLPLR